MIHGTLTLVWKYNGIKKTVNQYFDFTSTIFLFV